MSEVASGKMFKAPNGKLLNDPIFRSFCDRHFYLLKEDQDRKIVARGALELLREWMDLIQKFEPQEIDQALDYVANKLEQESR